MVGQRKGMLSMQSTLKILAEHTGLVLDIITVLMVAAGAALAVVGLGRHFLVQKQPMGPAIRAVWLQFAAWILISLEFALGADIVRTAIAPTWDEIGQLGVIAAIRTGLGFFLDRDIEGFRSIKMDQPE